jgi:hypothetical protein
MRGIYALVRGMLRVYEGGPTVALSLAIIWLFFGTSCGLFVMGETDNPLLNALPGIFAGIAGLLFITALVKYLRKSHQRFHQTLPDGTILIALQHQPPGRVSSLIGSAHILPLTVYVASSGYGDFSEKAAGRVVCPECQQEATFLIDGFKTKRVPSWSKLSLGFILLILALVLNISFGPFIWLDAPGWASLIRFCSWVILFLSMFCFVSPLRSTEVRRFNLPADHTLSQLTLTDAKNFRQQAITIWQRDGNWTERNG